LDEIAIINQQRADIWQGYAQTLKSLVTFQYWNTHSKNSYAYAPILFESEVQLLKVEAKLKENQILPRRYFYPSLDTLNYLQTNQTCSVSRDIVQRILCVPIYPGLSRKNQQVVSAIIKIVLKLKGETFE
jgi:dTDP-4-amino-4,6-dideoxygalactose transaminase